MLAQVLKRTNITTSTVHGLQRVELKPLPYEMSALEPVISGQTMEFHYARHHRGYVNNLNTLIEQANEAQATNNVADFVKLSNNIKFNGGGHMNHQMFWETFAPIENGGGVEPEEGSDLLNMINNEWGSMEKFKAMFVGQTAAI